MQSSFPVADRLMCCTFSQYQVTVTVYTGVRYALKNFKPSSVPLSDHVSQDTVRLEKIKIIITIQYFPEMKTIIYNVSVLLL